VKRALFYIFILVGAAIAALIMLILILPSMNWSALRKPGGMERKLAGHITSKWIRGHASEQPNPFRPTPENLKAGQEDFEEHCSGCHGINGDGENRFEADFYPPIAKLTEEAQEWSDGELYFIIVNGISMTGMPGFGKNHSSKEIWGMVLWVRHLAQLSPPEKASLESRARMTTEQHEKMMKETHPEPEAIQPPRNPGAGAKTEQH
jgi:hypothetical protein